MSKITNLTNAVSDYFLGTELKELNEKQRQVYRKYYKRVYDGELSPSYIENGITAMETTSKRDQATIMFFSKVLPNIINTSSIAASIVFLNPISLSGIGIGEALRASMFNIYNNEKVKLRDSIKNYKELEKSLE